MDILEGHVSPETAYLVDDYPYGFKLRCKIRYWLEYHPKHGVRFCSQTTNPKRGDIWNRPKYSTYADISGAMYLNGEGHVTWSGLSYYSDYQEAIQWRNQYIDGVHPESVERLAHYIETKRRYEEKKAAGMDYQQAAKEVVIEIIKEGGEVL